MFQSTTLNLLSAQRGSPASAASSVYLSSFLPSGTSAPSQNTVFQSREYRCWGSVSPARMSAVTAHAPRRLESIPAAAVWTADVVSWQIGRGMECVRTRVGPRWARVSHLSHKSSCFIFHQMDWYTCVCFKARECILWSCFFVLCCRFASDSVCCVQRNP